MGTSSSLLFLALCAWATFTFVDCSDVLRRSLFGTLPKTEKSLNYSVSHDNFYQSLEQKIFSKRNAFQTFGANHLDHAVDDHDAFSLHGNSWDLAGGVPQHHLEFHDIHDHHLRYLVASTAEEPDSGGRSSNLSIWLTLVIAAIAAAILS